MRTPQYSRDSPFWSQGVRNRVRGFTVIGVGVSVAGFTALYIHPLQSTRDDRRLPQVRLYGGHSLV
jgi:hypothetical protein